MRLPLGTRTTIWPIVVTAACALVLPATAGAGGGPRDHGNASPGSGKHGKGREGRPPAGNSKGRSRGHSKSRGHEDSRGHSRSHGRAVGRRHETGRVAPPSGNGASARKHGGSASGSPNGSKGRKAGKVTLCHATGSSTNPYVEITVSENAVKAHRAHQHGEDLIGVPEGGCPGGGKPGAAQHAKAAEHGKVTLCHATGSEANPFVAITVALPALAAHTRHQHGEDLVVVTGPCPGATVAGRIAAKTAPTGASPGVTTVAADPRPATAVAGVSDESGASRPASTTSVQTAGASDDSGSSLPFTGFGLILLAVLGTASLAVGTHIRRSD